MPTQTPIFRSITLDEGLQLTLGEPVSPEVMAHMEPVSCPGNTGGTCLQVEPGFFAGAQTIVAQLAGNGNVASMTFTYADGTDYDEMVANFTNELGPPEQSGSQQTAWVDPSTRFTLSSGPPVGSVLQDLAS